VTRTFAEYLFERFCDEHGIPCARVPETTAKTPDYEILSKTTPVVVEVKDIEPNAEEIESERLLNERGWGNATGGTPGGRVRAKIDAASPQIKARAQGRLPSILVVCDEGREIGHVEPYHIRVAMYGLEQIYVAVPPPGQGSPYATGMGYGPKRKMTPGHNTSISAIAAMFMPRCDVISLFVFHNKYAKVPLNPALLARHGVRQFTLGEAVPGKTADWEEIPRHIL
jgi:hypothetical protein